MAHSKAHAKHLKKMKQYYKNLNLPHESFYVHPLYEKLKDVFEKNSPKLVEFNMDKFYKTINICA